MSQTLKLLQVFKKNKHKPLTRLELYKLTNIFNIPGRVYDLRLGFECNIDSVRVERKGKSYPAYVFRY
jgi:hypothetical protein